MLCYKCFKEYEGSVTCPHCGYDMQTYVAEPYFLEAGCSLQDGRYLIGYAIGAGGFGVTYAGWDNVLRQRVAIKEFLPGEFSTRTHGMTKVTVYGGEKEEQFQEGITKFYDESKRLAGFRGKNGIVQIYDCFRENNTAYLVMEYLEGETLAERLKREKTIPYQEAVELMLPVLEALETVHKAGILHRDIAPNNIFLCKSGEVKLLDFGAARSATGTYSKSLTVLYKEGYTPEEQYRSHGNQGPWTDVYACAATLYRAITGIVPESAMERKIKDRLKTPSKCGVKLSPNIETAIMNALNTEVSHRTKSAEEFQKELLSEKQVSSHFVREKEKDAGRVPKWIWITFGLAAVAASVFIGLLATGRIKFDTAVFANLFVEEGYARVLNVVNMTEEDAREKLERVGLVLEVVEVKYSNQVEEGRIISQEEEKGEIVETATTVHVVVSKGAGVVQAPEMLGMKWEEAEKELEDLCLKYEVLESVSAEAPGYVISQSIDAGVELEQGQKISVEVSKGMGYDTSLSSEAQDLAGQKYEDAKQLLSQAGVYLQIEGYSYDDNIQKGSIVSQKIAAGTTLYGEDVQTVIISLGLEPRVVPKLSGLQMQDAVHELEELQLEAEIVRVLDQNRTEGEVVGQSIEAGETVDKFSKVSIEVIYHGIEVPNLVGLTEEEARNKCELSGFTFVCRYVLSENMAVISQSLRAGSLTQPGSQISVDIGLTESEFSSRLVDALNEERSKGGVTKLTVSGEWNTAAQKLADTGKRSKEFLEGYDFTWALPENCSGCFWATRENITTVADAVQKLPSDVYIDPYYTKIGIAYYGKRIVVLFAK